MKKKFKIGDFVAINAETDEVIAWGETIREVTDAAKETGVSPDNILITPVLPEDFTFY